MQLDTNKRSVFLLRYHLILVVKDGKKVITQAIGNRLKEIFENIGKNHYIILEEWGYEEDHVHVLFRARPSTCLSKFINAYKSASSRMIKDEFSEVKGQHFWSMNYCLLTTGNVLEEVIKRYIENQGKEHA